MCTMIYFPANPSDSPSVSPAPTSSSYAYFASQTPTRSINSFSHQLFTTHIP